MEHNLYRHTCFVLEPPESWFDSDDDVIGEDHLNSARNYTDFHRRAT